MNGLTFSLVVLASVGAAMLMSVYTCSIEARVINKEFGTEYTASEIFFAGHTIKNTLLGGKTRIDLDVSR